MPWINLPTSAVSSLWSQRVITAPSRTEVGKTGSWFPLMRRMCWPWGLLIHRAKDPRRAEYSALGPGRTPGQLRPSGLAFGGTEDVPFIATDNDGTRLAFHGTSCSAPLVVNGLADLSQRIGRSRVNAVTLRAFALHFAEPCKRGEGRVSTGHGRFRDDYAFLHDDQPHLAHILFSGTIGRQEFVPLAVPLPDGIPVPISLRYTLVTSTDVNPSDPVDYTKAGLDVVFRPHETRYRFTKKGRSDVILNTVSEAREASPSYQPGVRGKQWFRPLPTLAW